MFHNSKPYNQFLEKSFSYCYVGHCLIQMFYHRLYFKESFRNLVFWTNWTLFFLKLRSKLIFSIGIILFSYFLPYFSYIIQAMLNLFLFVKNITFQNVHSIWVLSCKFNLHFYLKHAHIYSLPLITWLGIFSSITTESLNSSDFFVNFVDRHYPYTYIKK